MTNTRDWITPLNCLAYSYLWFATSDGEISDEEVPVIFTCLKEYCPNTSDTEFQDALQTACRWFDQDSEALSGPEMGEQLENAAQFLKDGLFAGNDQLKKAFLDDLVRISMADGHFHENEKLVLSAFATLIGLGDYSF